MVRVSQVEIIESSDTLRDLMQQQQTLEGRERLQCLYWLKSGQVESVTAVARLLGRHRVSVQRWLRTYQDHGLGGLLGALRQSGGAPSKVSSALEAELRSILSSREGFGSYTEIHQWLIERGVEITYGGTHHYVRHRLGASLKVPRPQSMAQDETRVALFKTPSVLS
ncbi:MAG: helix-turn-helix domain-containing protein [Alkalinema sp. RL_2_19]|nr:helix-turn-helix domain-containing protein [Alkalinema sp. RL_2_19]